MNIAIIMSTLKQNELWLRKSIKSILMQEGNHNIDVYLNFDGCEPILFLESNVKCYKTCVRAGLAKGLNKMLAKVMQSQVEYDYIARMDDDDIMLPDRLHKQIEAMEKDRGIGFCGTLASIIDENDNIIGPNWEYAMYNNDDTIINKFLSGGCYIAHPTVMFRASMLFDSYDLWYNPLYKELEDYELWFRLLRLKYRYHLVSERLLLYRAHAGQETKRNGHAKGLVVEAVLKHFKETWNKFLC